LTLKNDSFDDKSSIVSEKLSNINQKIVQKTQEQKNAEK
jgi:hypothetical protein